MPLGLGGKGTAVADQDLILASALEHADTQLLAQIADESGLDGRLMGVLGFSGGLIVANIAAQALLGFWWWTPMPFVALAIFFVSRPIFAEETYLGPEALTFYAQYGGQTARAAREQLLADLDVAFQANSRRAGEKTRALTASLVSLGSGLVVAAVLILAVTPTTLNSDDCSHASSSATHSANAGACAGAFRVAPGWAARRYQIAPPPVH